MPFLAFETETWIRKMLFSKFHLPGVYRHLSTLDISIWPSVEMIAVVIMGQLSDSRSKVKASRVKNSGTGSSNQGELHVYC
jgi:hypothetical protein